MTPVWTQAECAAIAQHYPQHGTMGCLPFMPGRSKFAIMHKAWLLGVKREGNYRCATNHTFTIPERCHPMVKKLLKKLKAEGLSLRECARRAGLKESTVYQWRRRNPSLLNFIAACNVAGLDLKLVETDK